MQTKHTNHSRLRTAIGAALAAAIALTSSTFADIPDLFDSPWIGYDTAVYPEGLYPVSSQSADFNGDGVPDLATVSFGGTAWLSILFGDGSGGYLAPETYPLLIESIDLVVADFDGDKDLDIVTSDTGRHWEGFSISLYLNDGTGHFTFADSFTIGNTGPSGITTADFNGDGWPDVATANDASIICNNTVSVLLNNSGNGFTGAQVYSISSCTNDIDSGDLNNDGSIDLVVAHETNRFTVMINDGEGGFTPQAPIMGITAGPIPQEPVVHIADIDLDGDRDVFFSNQDTGGVNNGAIGLWRNNGAGGFGPPETLSFNWYNGGGIDIDTADVTGDGWPDILCATAGSGNWFLFESDGAGGFASPRKLRAGHLPSAIDTPDLDNDGDIDVVVIGTRSLEACVYLNPGDGSFVQPEALEFVPASFAPAFTTNIEAGDIDADGDLDIVVGYAAHFVNQYGISVRRNNGDGTFSPAELYSHFTEPVFVRLRDLDGDADLDLIWVEDQGQFRMRFNDGTGSFGSVVTSANVYGGAYFDLFDVDNDDDLDVVIAAGVFDVAVLLNNGSGAFMSPISTDVGGFFNVLGMGDFDADGNLDVLTESGIQGFPRISFGHGNGTFGPTFTVPTGRGVRSFGIGHLDGDANLDFAAIYNLDEKGVSIRRGHGDGNFFIPNHYHGSFQSADYPVGGRTELVDVDGDGNLDVLFANAMAQDFSYWKNNGDGSFQEVLRYGAGHNVHDLVAGDFNGDGVIDVAMSAEIDNGNWSYTGVVIITGTSDSPQMPGDLNGDGTVGAEDLAILLGSWGPCDGCPADLNGDGIVDAFDLAQLLGNWG